LLVKWAQVGDEWGQLSARRVRARQSESGWYENDASIRVSGAKRFELSRPSGVPLFFRPKSFEPDLVSALVWREKAAQQRARSVAMLRNRRANGDKIGGMEARTVEQFFHSILAPSSIRRRRQRPECISVKWKPVQWHIIALV